MCQPSQQISLNDPKIFQNEGHPLEACMISTWITRIDGQQNWRGPKLAASLFEIYKLTFIWVEMICKNLLAWNWNRHILHFIFLMEACIERFQILFKSFDSLKCWDLKLTISFHITCQGIKLKLDRWDKAIFKLHVWQQGKYTLLYMLIPKLLHMKVFAQKSPCNEVPSKASLTPTTVISFTTTIGTWSIL